jgi:ATP-dependent helicase/nuclease subunit A
VPFSLHYKKPVNGVDGADYLLDGVIDFAFLEDNAWVIIDFKTDTIPAEQIQQQAERYRLQLGLYALALEELTAYPVKDLIILFARSRQDVCFAWNEAARSAAQALLTGRSMTEA